MQQQNIFSYFKNSFRQSGVLMKLIFINLGVFVCALLLQLIGYLYVDDKFAGSIMIHFCAPGDPADLIYAPWTLITYMFTHFDLGHFLFNILALFFTSVIFLQHFSGQRLVSTYILGGIAGYVVHIASFMIFPVFAEEASGPLLGASASVMAIFIAIAFHRPTLRVYFLGIIPVPLIVLAGLYILADLSGVMSQQEGDSRIAHFAHLGGAIFGAISIIGVQSPKQFMNFVDRFFAWFRKPSFVFKRKPKMKVHPGGSSAARQMTDDEYNYNKKLRQEKLDAILDKIGKKGYEGLTKEEKDFLFNESQRK